MRQPITTTHKLGQCSSQPGKQSRSYKSNISGGRQIMSCDMSVQNEANFDIIYVMYSVWNIFHTFSILVVFMQEQVTTTNIVIQIKFFLTATRPSVRPSVRLPVCSSVRLSVCPSHLLTMFPSSYHHEILRNYYQWQKWRPCKRSRSEVKDQCHEVKTQHIRLRIVTPV